MSHRRPLTSADKYVMRETSRHPELLSLSGGAIDAISKEAFDACPEYVSLFARGGAKAAWEHDDDVTMLRPVSVAIWSRWRTCRHVYRFDRTLSEELGGMGLPDDMPVDTLAMLPYPIVYVEAKVPYHSVLGSELGNRGFFAWREEAGLIVAFDLTDVERSDAAFIMRLEHGTLGAVVDDLVRGDRDFAGTVGIEGVDDYANMRETVVTVVNHLLYVISANSEQEVVYRPSGNAKRANRTSQSTIHEVGTRVGRRLSQARVRYVGGKGPKGEGAKRPHVRAAHWHHYWVGPRADASKRRLVVRWLEPIFVGAGEPDTIVHES